MHHVHENSNLNYSETQELSGPESKMSAVDKVDKNGESIYQVGNSPPIGEYCVIGNRGDNTGKPLSATKKDVDMMAGTLKRLGMKPVVEKHYSKMTAAEVINFLNQLKAANLSRCRCFVFYYTGHGKDCGIHLDDNSTYPFILIVDSIMSLPDLKGRPKVFLFDCCRAYDGNVHVDDCKDRHVVESYTDCIIAYSCSKGEKAYITTNHSVFTKYLCLTLSSRYRQWPLVSILTQSSRLTQKTMDGFFTQTPQVILRLQKQLYFCCKLLMLCCCVDTIINIMAALFSVAQSFGTVQERHISLGVGLNFLGAIFWYVVLFRLPGILDVLEHNFVMLYV